MRTYVTILLLLVASSSLYSQSEAGIEQYHYLGPNTNSTIVPVVHLQSKNGWYGEARYNYDELNTFSILAGKTFSLGRNNNVLITPMTGWSVGDFNGLTLGVNAEFENDGYFFNNQSQYSFSTTKNYKSFAFTWCEFGYRPLKWLYGGLSFQYTREAKEAGIFEPGLLTGLSFKRVSIPLYYFNNLKGNNFFILGINWEWQRQ